MAVFEAALQVLAGNAHVLKGFCDLAGVVDALPHLDRLTGLQFCGLYAFGNAPHVARFSICSASSEFDS